MNENNNINNKKEEIYGLLLESGNLIYIKEIKHKGRKEHMEKFKNLLKEINPQKSNLEGKIYYTDISIKEMKGREIKKLIKEHIKEIEGIKNIIELTFNKEDLKTTNIFKKKLYDYIKKHKNYTHMKKGKNFNKEFNRWFISRENDVKIAAMGANRNLLIISTDKDLMMISKICGTKVKITPPHNAKINTMEKSKKIDRKWKLVDNEQKQNATAERTTEFTQQTIKNNQERSR